MSKKHEIFKDKTELLLNFLYISFKNNKMDYDITFTDKEIENIVTSLPDINEISIEREEENYSSESFFVNFVRHIFLPTLVGIVLLIVTLRYLQKNFPNYYIETTFLINHPQAKVVQIVGDFTNWEPITLNKKGELWELKVNLRPGQYRYIYIIDGMPFLDPQKEIFEDQFGNKNSIIYV